MQNKQHSYPPDLEGCLETEITNTEGSKTLQCIPVIAKDKISGNEEGIKKKTLQPFKNICDI